MAKYRLILEEEKTGYSFGEWVLFAFGVFCIILVLFK